MTDTPNDMPVDNSVDKTADKIQDRLKSISIQISEETARQIEFLATRWGEPAVRHNTPVITRCVERSFLAEVASIASGMRALGYSLEEIRRALGKIKEVSERPEQFNGLGGDPFLAARLAAASDAMTRALQKAEKLEEILAAGDAILSSAETKSEVQP